MVRIAGSVDLDELIERLRTSRPVFHSEADFQHHVAWQAHLLDQSLTVRLEMRPDPTVREQVDLFFACPELTRSTVVELKYLKAAWRGTVQNEPFDLPNTGAHDIVRYDVVKDVERVERFVRSRPGTDGLVMVLTNDSLHWRSPIGVRETIAEAFRVHHGAVLGGTRAWGERAGVGTTRGRERELALSGTYPLSWVDYSQVGGSSGRFRLLVIHVDSVSAAEPAREP